MLVTWEGYYKKLAVIDGVVCTIEVSILLDQQLKEYTASKVFRDQYLRNAEGFLLVYSVTSRSSFDQIKEFHKQIQVAKYSSPTIPIMLVGHNMEQDTEREVKTLEGHELARELGCEFVEVSSKNDINVAKAFFDVVRSLRRQHIHAALRFALAPNRRNRKLSVTLSDLVRRQNRSRRS
jgi:GTPase KRas protein